MNQLTALLVFPGLLFVLGLAIALTIIIQGVPRLNNVRLPRFGFETGTALLSILLAALGSALLPWPLQTIQQTGLSREPFAAFIAIEAAFLVALLPGLITADALTNRATIREAQIGVAGRVVIWLALATMLWNEQFWTWTSLPGRLLLAAGALLALPAAIGVGPFAADRILSVSGAEHGLDNATAGFVQFARRVRGGVLVAGVALLFVQLSLARSALALVVWAAVVLVLALVLQRFQGRMPRLTLPAALRWCWWRALPLATVGLVYLVFVR